MNLSWTYVDDKFTCTYFNRVVEKMRNFDDISLKLNVMVKS